MGITVRQFVRLLWQELNAYFSEPQAVLIDDEQLLRYGHVKGWLEDEDEVFNNRIIDKRAAARIVHQVMKIELKIPDIDDTKSAEVLKDLYTCRTCVNHVAQVFIRKLMAAEEMEHEGDIVLIFNMLKPVTKEQAEGIILAVKNLI